MEGTYIPYQFTGKNLKINQYLILDEQSCDMQSYDLFYMQMDTHVAKLLEETEDLSAFPVLKSLDKGGNNVLEDFENKKVTLCAPVYSKNETRVIIRLNCCIGKLWVNGKCLTIHSEIGVANSFLTASFHKGRNDLVLELLAIPGFFSIRIIFSPTI